MTGIVRFVLGAVIILVVMVLAGPVGLFVGGGLWAALTGQVLATTVGQGEPADSSD
jgi:hypothetical protein